MVNDTTTLNGSLQECIDRLETNLQAMGVSDAEFDSSTGILGLIDEIPNISPSVGGIELDTNITLDESNLETEIIGGVKHYKVYNNDRTTLTAYINALYDDTTVDMKGVLQGATVSYDLSQIGGDDSTAISDNDGKFSMVIRPTSLQDDIHYNVYMSFDGTGTDYKSCDELFRFMVRHYYLITFGQSEYTTYDGSCTVTATLTEDGVAMPYVELHLVSGDMTYATLTDENGVATFNLQNLQTGTETWTCTYGNATATCTVTYHSYLFYDSGVTGSANSNYTKSNSNMTISVGNNGTTVSASANSDCYYYENVLLQGDFRAEFTIVNVVAFGGIGFLNSSKTKQWSLEYNLMDSPYGLEYSSPSDFIYQDTTMGKTIMVERIGTTLNIYVDGSLISTKTVTSADGYIGWKTHRDRSRSVTFKDFSIISL